MFLVPGCVGLMPLYAVAQSKACRACVSNACMMCLQCMHDMPGSTYCKVQVLCKAMAFPGSPCKLCMAIVQTDRCCTYNYEHHKNNDSSLARPSGNLGIILPAAELAVLQGTAQAPKSKEGTVQCSCLPNPGGYMVRMEPSWPEDQKPHNC